MSNYLKDLNERAENGSRNGAGETFAEYWAKQDAAILEAHKQIEANKGQHDTYTLVAFDD